MKLIEKTPWLRLVCASPSYHFWLVAKKFLRMKKSAKALGTITTLAIFGLNQNVKNTIQCFEKRESSYLRKILPSVAILLLLYSIKLEK